MKTVEFMDKIYRNGEIVDAEMSEEIKKAENDPALMYGIAKEAGVTDSYEVFCEKMKRFLEDAADELSEEELELVTGGRSYFENISIDSDDL